MHNNNHTCVLPFFSLKMLSMNYTWDLARWKKADGLLMVVKISLLKTNKTNTFFSNKKSESWSMSYIDIASSPHQLESVELQAKKYISMSCRTKMSEKNESRCFLVGDSIAYRKSIHMKRKSVIFLGRAIISFWYQVQESLIFLGRVNKQASILSEVDLFEKKKEDIMVMMKWNERSTRMMMVIWWESASWHWLALWLHIL